jgi:hypothetical protein
MQARVSPRAGVQLKQLACCARPPCHGQEAGRVDHARRDSQRKACITAVGESQHHLLAAKLCELLYDGLTPYEHSLMQAREALFRFTSKK